MTETRRPQLPEDFGNPWMSNLEEIGLPEPVAFSFEAPGWTLLMVVLLMTGLWLAWRFWRRWRAAAYRRRALEELSIIDSPARLSALLKRVALVTYPRANVASLYGEAWLGFLDRTLGTTDFTRGPGRPLADLAYDPAAAGRLSEKEREDISGLARRWIRKHRRVPVGEV